MTAQRTTPATLINLFEVHTGAENDFIEWWERSSGLLSKEPGFLDATLHQNTQPGGLFQFINVAHWESAEALDQARAKHKETLQSFSRAKGHPGMYEVVSYYA